MWRSRVQVPYAVHFGIGYGDGRLCKSLADKFESCISHQTKTGPQRQYRWFLFIESFWLCLFYYAFVAQLVLEHPAFNRGVASSSLAGGTKYWEWKWSDGNWIRSNLWYLWCISILPMKVQNSFFISVVDSTVGSESPQGLVRIQYKNQFYTPMVKWYHTGLQNRCFEFESW